MEPLAPSPYASVVYSVPRPAKSWPQATSVDRSSVGAPPTGDLFGAARAVPFDRSVRRSFRPPDPRGRSGPTRKLARAPTCVNLTEVSAAQRIHGVRAGSGAENAPRQRVTQRDGVPRGANRGANGSRTDREPALDERSRRIESCRQCIRMTLASVNGARTNARSRSATRTGTRSSRRKPIPRISTPTAAVKDATVTAMRDFAECDRSLIHEDRRHREPDTDRAPTRTRVAAKPSSTALIARSWKSAVRPFWIAPRSSAARRRRPWSP